LRFEIDAGGRKNCPGKEVEKSMRTIEGAFRPGTDRDAASVCGGKSADWEVIAVLVLEAPGGAFCGAGLCGV